MEGAIKFPQIISVGCGIDVHQNLMVATIRKSNEEYETRSFDGFTSSLTALRDWCKTEGVTHIAMESTGVYWKPVFNILEEDFEKNQENYCFKHFHIRVIYINNLIKMATLY